MVHTRDCYVEGSGESVRCFTIDIVTRRDKRLAESIRSWVGTDFGERCRTSLDFRELKALFKKLVTFGPIKEEPA